MDELKRAQVESTISQAQFMKEMNQPPQEKPKLEYEGDELANSMAEMARCQAELQKSQAKFMDETSVILQAQSAQLKSLEVQMGKTSDMSFEGQQESLPSILNVNPEKKKWNIMRISP